MPTVLLVRHGRSESNQAGTLAGRTPGVGLAAEGRDQAAAVADRIAVLAPRIATVVSSPLERCRETAKPIAKALGIRARTDARLTECGYGDWTGRSLSDLAKEPLWRTVQAHPSAVTFPGGEAMAAMQHRAVAAVRAHDAAVAAEHGDTALWVAVSHGDVIKSIVADALGCHLDQFQRIVIDTASVTVISYTAVRPFVVATNDTGSALDKLLPAPKPTKRKRRTDSDAVVGGR